MEERLQVHQNSLLEILQHKLQHALESLQKVVKVDSDLKTSDGSGKTSMNRTSVKKARFTIVFSGHLKRTVADLENWHNLFDPSWYLITRIANTKIDMRLDCDSTERTPSLSNLKSLRDAIRSPLLTDGRVGSIFLDGNTTIPGRTLIPFSSLMSAQRSGSTDLILVDQMRCGPVTNPASVVKDVRDLARILSQVDPLVFGLLSCQGVIKVYDSEEQLTGFDFLFGVPPKLSSPRSLREILLSQSSNASLNERFSLAALLARSVFFMHASHFVHKNIRPETVIVFRDSKLQLGKPFLVGFEKFRLDTSRTHRFGDDLWYRNIYRHPQRQGFRPEEDFVMQHDVYSLGVVLLELGLSYSFVQSAHVNTGQDSSSWSGEAPPNPNARIGIAEYLLETNVRRKANSIKRKFASVATEQLPILMGQKYTQVVISCLTCLDKDSEGFGDESEFEDEDGIKVGMRFIEKVCSSIAKVMKMDPADSYRSLQSLTRYRYDYS